MHYIVDKTELVTEDRAKAKSNILNNQMGGKPCLSLIMPVYQEEKIIENQLKRFPKSIREKYNFELIVSDGGSSDKTVEIASKYADIVVVHDKPYRQTISEGRNRGAEVANADVLVFLNADSYPENIDDFFLFISNWAKGSSVSDGIAVACYVTAFPEEIVLKDKLFYSFHNFYVRVLNFIGLGMGRGECQIVRSDFFKSVNGYRNEIVAGEDFDLYSRLAKIGKIKYAAELRVLESPRRFRKYGYVKTVWYWTLNSLSVMLFGKSVSKEWEAVR